MQLYSPDKHLNVRKSKGAAHLADFKAKIKLRKLLSQPWTFVAKLRTVLLTASATSLL